MYSGLIKFSSNELRDKCWNDNRILGSILKGHVQKVEFEPDVLICTNLNNEETLVVKNTAQEYGGIYLDDDDQPKNELFGRNGGIDCDVTSGPCACGAWH